MPHPPVEIGEPIVSRDEMREGLLEFARLYLAAYLTGAWQMALGFVLLVIIFVAPAGLYGLIRRSGAGSPGSRPGMCAKLRAAG